MSDPASFWPGALGISFLVIGIITWRSEVRTIADGAFGLTALGPVLVGAALAAFAGEHFTAAPALARIVPKFMPAPLFFAYLVGIAHLAFALSVIARRYIRWSSLALALMFALFVVLMDLPAAIAHPAARMGWSLAARQATFAVGALALFATVTSDAELRRARILAAVARIWTAVVLVFYGAENILYPQFAPGVPSLVLAQPWVPLSASIACATGILLVGFGIAMFVAKYAHAAAAGAGALMTLLTIGLYVPQWAIARGVGQQVVAINFVFDTLLFGGAMLVVSRAAGERAGERAGEASEMNSTSRSRTNLGCAEWNDGKSDSQP